jgi:hypothetical protein
MVSDRDIVERCVAVGSTPMVRAALVTAVPQTVAPEQPADPTVVNLLFTCADGLPVMRQGRLVCILCLVQVAASS